MDRPRIPDAFRATPEGAAIQAHLDNLHDPVDAGLDRLAHDVLVQGGPSRGTAAARSRSTRDTLRVRLGHGLVSLGAAVAGEEQASHPHPNHAQRRPA